MSEVNRIIEILARVSDPRREPTQHEQDGRLLYHHIATLTAELAESQRLHDLGGSREANLLADVATLTAENERSIAAARLTQQNIAILTAENERLREVIEHLPVI